MLHIFVFYICSWVKGRQTSFHEHVNGKLKNELFCLFYLFSCLFFLIYVIYFHISCSHLKVIQRETSHCRVQMKFSLLGRSVNLHFHFF